MKPQPALHQLLSKMRASYQVYRDSHWTVRGNDYYGNHLLLERIYAETEKEIDGLAEMMVGSYGSEIITEHKNETSKWVESLTDPENPMNGALWAAQEVRASIDVAYDALKQAGELGHGWDDFLMALAQEKDTHLYLLQQATAASPQVHSADRAANPMPRRRNATAEQAGCVLAKHAWDRDTVECGPDAPTPAQAAQILADKRWTLPPELRKQKARLLR